MRDDYIKQALGKIMDPNILINVVSRRVKQLKRGNRPMVESLEKLSPRIRPCARSSRKRSATKPERTERGATPLLGVPSGVGLGNDVHGRAK